jgi:hypothetical protein
MSRPTSHGASVLPNRAFDPCCCAAPLAAWIMDPTENWPAKLHDDHVWHPELPGARAASGRVVQEGSEEHGEEAQGLQNGPSSTTKFNCGALEGGSSFGQSDTVDCTRSTQRTRSTQVLLTLPFVWDRLHTLMCVWVQPPDASKKWET